MIVLDTDHLSYLEWGSEESAILRIRIGTMDLKIAASCLCEDALLLTRNTVDYSKVPGLRFEDWTQ